MTKSNIFHDKKKLTNRDIKELPQPDTEHL